MYEIIKEVTGMDNKVIIDYKYESAYHMIKNYLNIDNPDMKQYEHVVLQLTIYLIETPEGNITSKTQGKRSESYGNNLPPHIVEMLPMPYARSL